MEQLKALDEMEKIINRNIDRIKTGLPAGDQEIMASIRNGVGQICKCYRELASEVVKLGKVA